MCQAMIVAGDEALYYLFRQVCDTPNLDTNGGNAATTVIRKF